jgi:hypothetical protein
MFEIQPGRLWPAAACRRFKPTFSASADRKARSFLGNPALM